FAVELGGDVSVVALKPHLSLAQYFGVNGDAACCQCGALHRQQFTRVDRSVRCCPCVQRGVEANHRGSSLGCLVGKERDLITNAAPKQLEGTGFEIYSAGAASGQLDDF